MNNTGFVSLNPEVQENVPDCSFLAALLLNDKKLIRFCKKNTSDPVASIHPYIRVEETFRRRGDLMDYSKFQLILTIQTRRAHPLRRTVHSGSVYPGQDTSGNVGAFDIILWCKWRRE